MASVRQTVAVLSSPDALADMGFEACMAAEPEDAELVALLENEQAECMANFAFALNAARLRRHMFMLRGWPSLSVIMLAPEQSEFYINLLRTDWGGLQVRRGPRQRRSDEGLPPLGLSQRPGPPARRRLLGVRVDAHIWHRGAPEKVP